MKLLRFAALAAIAAVVLTAIVVYSGLFNVAADEPHWGLTHRIIETLRERSIESRSDKIEVASNLDDPKVIAGGAGEYDEMCTGCHLAPGMKDTEMRTGLYPQPPNLTEHGAHRSPAQQFWIIKHGLKMSGMPAWGLTHDDERIWSMVAFLRKLPELTPAAYHELIEAGEGGHHHDHMGEEEHEHNAQTGTLPAGAVAAAASVDRFQSLLSKGDTAGAASVLDPSVLIFESGEAEKSREEYASHHLKADAQFMKGTNVRMLSRTGNAVGDLAWIATESELTTSGPKPMSVITTETMVLTRDQQSWRVAHIHWSSRPKKN